MAPRHCNLIESTLMFDGLEHTAIASPSPKTLAQWYVDHLEFHINFEYDGNYFVRAQNGAMLEIIPSEGARGEQKMRDPGIRHLAILTEDVDRMVRFYTNSFGLKIVKGVGTATYLTDGHINLAIIPIGPEREIEGNQLKEGINHFGFEVDSVADLVPVCKQWGAATDTKKRPPNREAEYRVHDPDGNPIDLSQHGWPH